MIQKLFEWRFAGGGARRDWVGLGIGGYGRLRIYGELTLRTLVLTITWELKT